MLADSTFFEKSKTFYLASQIKSLQKSSNQSKSQNIFIKDEDYIQQAQGPQYDKIGKIIGRSIVGKTDDFIKMQRKQSQMSITGSSPKNMKQSFMTMKHSSFNVSLIQRKDSNNKHLKNKLSHTITIPSKNIQQYMQQSKRRMISNQEKQYVFEQSLPLIEQNELTRERRAIDSFQERQDAWNDVGQHLSNKCERDMNQTLFQRSQDFRSKKEMLSQLPEPLSKTFWKDQLRNQEQPKELEFDIIKRQSTQNLFSEKFKNLINSKIKNHYTSEYLRIDGENKFQQELHMVNDVVIDENIQIKIQKQYDGTVAEDWNPKIKSKRSSIRLLGMMTK